MAQHKPKYIQVFNELKELIQQKEFVSGSFLPSEKELMITFSVSRDTIRKALNLLLDQGLIQKIPGKGSLVLDADKVLFPINGIYSFKELSRTIQGKVETNVKFVDEIPMTPELEKELGFITDKLILSKRVRSINGERVILDYDYFDGNIISELTSEIASESIYEYIENNLGLKIGFSQKEITAARAVELETELLDLDEFNTLICVRSHTYLIDGTPFQYTISKHRPDKFRFVDFVRRV